MTICAVAGWMLVQPLNGPTANEQLKLGRVHSIGEIVDPEMAARVPFAAGDHICWVDSSNVHVLNKTLLLVPLNVVMAYEQMDDADADVNGKQVEVGDG